MTAEKRTRPAVRTKETAKKIGATADAQDSRVASALRSAYEEAVKEQIPTEFLDLLGKLS